MTTRYYINDVKCGVSSGNGIACGPVPEAVTASVQFREGDGPFMWLTLSEYDGIANFYLTEEDIYDKVQDIDGDDEEFIDMLNEEYYINSFEEISFGEYGEYEDILQSIDENRDNPAGQLIMYLIALVRCGWDELPGLVEAGKGMFADEIDLTGIDME